MMPFGKRHRRTHINLFVDDSYLGVIASSVVHAWAKGEADSITTVYADYIDVTFETRRLIELISTARSLNADPVERRIAVFIGVIPDESELIELRSLGIEVRVSYPYYTGVLRKFARKWFGVPWGFRALNSADEITAGMPFYTMGIFYKEVGGQEMELAMTAYLHDLPFPKPVSAREMRENYYRNIIKQEVPPL